MDTIKNEDVQAVKLHLGGKAPKTVNNVLTVLNKLLIVAQEWKVIDGMPCSIKLLPVTPKEAPFHDFDEYRNLMEAARSIDSQSHIIVLLGGDAGLRCGEIMALEWTDISFQKREIHVQQSEWKGNITVPKGGRSRRIPMTLRLSEALQAHRHLRGERLLSEADGQPLTQKVVQGKVRKAAKKANLKNTGVHILRHSFCSHLAMKGAPVRTIQELAGHTDIKTTQQYMHLSPRAVDAAIRLLEELPESSTVLHSPPQSWRDTGGGGNRSAKDE